MAKVSTDELLDAFGEMTVVELSEFVKAFEDKFGVTAAVPMAAPAAGGGAGAAVAEPEEERDECDGILTAAAEKKIALIKAVRALPSLGLKGGRGLEHRPP